MFEIIKSDLAGRIGILHTNHGKIETPAYVPVIHPVRQAIATSKIREMGFDLVITNAFITRNYYGQEAEKRGIHDIIKFDGAIMTDSGGYQVLEYGDVDVSPFEIADFETKIGCDIAIPLDKPTGFGLQKKKARSFVEQTLKAAKKTIEQKSNNGQIWVGPIQGSEHFELVKKSTISLVDYGFEMLALGSPVEFMESYNYRLLAEMIITAKKSMPLSLPLHLFGAGHPLTIPLAIALGCDTFDSASYILYAREGRYISEDKTTHISKISYFSCTCEVCSKFTPKELLSMKEEQRIDKIALHNLYAIKSEVERVKEAIFEGRLWEYINKKIRAHPRLFECQEIFTNNSAYFAKTTPQFKNKAVFLFTREDQFRPEIISYHNIVRKFKTKKKTLVITSEPTIKPAYLSREYTILKKKFDNDSVQFCYCDPFLGMIPFEISDIYPASHYVSTRIEFRPEDFPIFEKTWNTFFAKNQFTIIHCNKNDRFIQYFVKSLPRRIKIKNLN